MPGFGADSNQQFVIEARPEPLAYQDMQLMIDPRILGGPKDTKRGSETCSWQCRGTEAGSFQPQLLMTPQRLMPAFNDEVLPLYAQGGTRREIQKHLAELYALESPQP